MYKKIKTTVFKLVDCDYNDKTSFDWFDFSILGLIIINTICIVLESIKSLSIEYADVFRYIEVFSIIIYSIEYSLRLWTADLMYPELTPTKARLKYISSWMALIDLIAILPFFVSFLPMDLRFLRMIRVFRVFRLFKANRYTSSISTITRVLKKKSSELISTFVFVIILMLIAAIFMYNVENLAQPDKFENVLSALWWSVATFTTVGYGDIFPITSAGKILASLIALLGIGLVAVPTGIITAGFSEEISNRKEAQQKCKDEVVLSTDEQQEVDDFIKFIIGKRNK